LILELRLWLAQELKAAMAEYIVYITIRIANFKFGLRVKYPLLVISSQAQEIYWYK